MGAYRAFAPLAHAVGLIEDREAAVGPGEDRRHAPDRHAIAAPSFGRRLAVLVENLPRHGPALVPARPLRPDQDGFLPGVARHSRVLPPLAHSRGSHGL